MITKVLVAIDGSESSNRALDFGLDLAEKYNASVTVLNVVNAPVYAPSPDPLTISPDVALLSKDLRKVHESILAKALERAASFKPNVSVRTELRDGNPSDQIVLTASEGGFEVIVVGQGGESKARKFLLGSTSQRVVNAAECAVLIVK